MGFRDYKVIWNDGFGNDFLLENIVDIRITRVKDAKSNSCEIILNNRARNLIAEGSMKLKIGTTLQVFATEGIVDITDTTHLLGTFDILNVEYQPSARTVKLICGDKTYKMLTTLYSRDITDTVDNIVFNVVQSSQQTGDTQNSITTNIVSTKSDGVTALPSKQYTSVWKTSYDVLTELSQTDYTEDTKPYIFWFDPDDTFHWTYQSDTPESETFSFGSDPVIEMKLTKKEAESIKMVIFDAGTDLNGNQILDFYNDPNAGTIKNAIKFQPMTDIAERLKQDTTIIDNDIFRQKAIDQGKAEAKRIIDKGGRGLWEATITIVGKHYTPGKLYTVTAPQMGFSARNLRLDRVVHTLNKNGWSTQLTLVEDPSEE
jgi:hypothetical protein